MLRVLSLLLVAAPLLAQAPRNLTVERAGYLAWLKQAPNSPLAAIARQVVGEGVRLGPADADIPLPGVEEYRILPSGDGVVLDGPGGRRSISRSRPYRIKTYALYLTGPHPGTVLTVFADGPRKQPPGHYDYDPKMVFTGPLIRPEGRKQVRVLASDGIETEATEVGSFVVPLGGGTPLRVLRIPIGDTDESELEIFFQDQTNDQGSYPAGRFVSLIPQQGGLYRLDFNRARNPFCAYSPVYPCPVPWAGNLVRGPVRAGERYAGGGLDPPPAKAETP
jgi:hypothetical protein